MSYSHRWCVIEHIARTQKLLFHILHKMQCAFIQLRTILRC